MILALAAIVLAIVAFYVVRRRGMGNGPEVARESTPALDGWIADALEVELA